MNFEDYSLEQLLKLKEFIKDPETLFMLQTELHTREGYADVLQEEADKLVLDSYENYNEKLLKDVEDEVFGPTLESYEKYQDNLLKKVLKENKND